jgi:hypothetical protein
VEEGEDPRSKLLYHGSKLFWRTKTNMDVHIYEEIPIIASDIPNTEEMAVQRARQVAAGKVPALAAPRAHTHLCWDPF